MRPYLYRKPWIYPLPSTVRRMARGRALSPRDVGGCTCDPHNPDYEDCNYHLAAKLQPWNHRFPWNCPDYWDGCNCNPPKYGRGGPWKTNKRR